MEDALRMNSTSLANDNIEVIREFGTSSGSLRCEKHKVLQILVNLVRNATECWNDSERLDKRLTLRISNGSGQVRISVTDNGMGIPADNLTRIFARRISPPKNRVTVLACIAAPGGKRNERH